MCRLLAYSGPPLRLEGLVTGPEHGLERQAWAPREMTSGTLNADGFGFAWYDADADTPPFVYRNVLPIWNDTNLPSLGRYVRSGHMLAYVRSATPGQSLDIGNTQPFVAGPVSLLHNGFVTDFARTLLALMRRTLDDEAWQVIRGTTDSEHLFGWLVHHIRREANLAEGLRAGLVELLAFAPEIHMTLNFIVSDGATIAASRLGAHAGAPSLYTLAGHPRFPDAALIASEPLFDDPAWKPVPEGYIVSIDAERQIDTRPLAG